MRSGSLVFSSWFMLVLAMVSWAGGAYFFVTLWQMHTERAAYAAEAAMSNLQQGQAAQLRALVRETSDERAALSQAAGVDVLSAVNLIESTSASGTPVHVVNASAVKTPSKTTSQM